MTKRCFIFAGCCKAVCEIAAADARTADPPLLLLVHQFEITTPSRLRAFNNPVGDSSDGRIESHAAGSASSGRSKQQDPQHHIDARVGLLLAMANNHFAGAVA